MRQSPLHYESLRASGSTRSRPWVAGISGGSQGAFSVALSGGYPDDVDWGYAFTYTGSGGRNLKGTKANPLNLRTAPQSSDQTFDNSFNKALKISSEKKKPVRVIRGYKLDSPYAPYEGYRYDGLYRVEKAWQEKGMDGFLVCKFAFKRLPGQPPLPRRPDADASMTTPANKMKPRIKASAKGLELLRIEHACSYFLFSGIPVTVHIHQTNTHPSYWQKKIGA
ncbi:PUA-like domain-containing protein [Mycena leptocephala]|nr:PUA-like domain-containing protein [Mycena leptocephala]